MESCGLHPFAFWTMALLNWVHREMDRSATLTQLYNTKEDFFGDLLPAAE